MKKMMVVAVVVLTIMVTGFIACNSSDTPSKNKEGIMEVNGPSDTEKAAADTQKIFTPI